MILSIGAGGRFSGLVVRELARRGARVRGLVHRLEDVDRAEANGAAEIAVGNLYDSKSLDAAMRDVTAVFYTAPVFQRDEATLGLNVIGAARRARVQRFVFSSVIHPTLDLENHSEKIAVESALFGSGMEFVVLQPGMHFQRLESAWPEVIEHGVFGEPFSATARIARVDSRDVADVAATALLENRLTYGTFELCADGLPNREEIAAMMGEVLGRWIEAAEPTFNYWLAKTGLQYDEQQRRLVKTTYEYYGAHGLYGSSVTLRAILEREPRTLRSYIEELAGVEQMRSVA